MLETMNIFTHFHVMCYIRRFGSEIANTVTHVVSKIHSAIPNGAGNIVQLICSFLLSPSLGRLGILHATPIKYNVAVNLAMKDLFYSQSLV